MLWLVGYKTRGQPLPSSHRQGHCWSQGRSLTWIWTATLEEKMYFIQLLAPGWWNIGKVGLPIRRESYCPDHCHFSCSIKFASCSAPRKETAISGTDSSTCAPVQCSNQLLQNCNVPINFCHLLTSDNNLTLQIAKVEVDFRRHFNNSSCYLENSRNGREVFQMGSKIIGESEEAVI